MISAEHCLLADWHFRPGRYASLVIDWQKSPNVSESQRNPQGGKRCGWSDRSLEIIQRWPSPSFPISNVCRVTVTGVLGNTGLESFDGKGIAEAGNEEARGTSWGNAACVCLVSGAEGTAADGDGGFGAPLADLAVADAIDGFVGPFRGSGGSGPVSV